MLFSHSLSDLWFTQWSFCVSGSVADSQVEHDGRLLYLLLSVGDSVSECVLLRVFDILSNMICVAVRIGLLAVIFSVLFGSPISIAVGLLLTINV